MVYNIWYINKDANIAALRRKFRMSSLTCDASIFKVVILLMQVSILEDFVSVATIDSLDQYANP